MPRPAPARQDAGVEGGERRLSASSGRRAPLGLPELIAIGVGGMIGGGIFSMLGLAVSIAGHAAALAFLLGAVVAFLAGYSYVRLALAFRRDGASYVYLARAFPRRPFLATLTGWAVSIGYVGTLALYAFTFGAYGAELLGQSGNAPARMALSTSVLAFFLLVNLRGTRASGRAEDLVVYAKILILAVFAVAGLASADTTRMQPLFDRGISAVFMAGALIFVAFEGFQLITNAVNETDNPSRNIPLGIHGSIAITSFIYVLLAVVALGNLSAERIIAAQEYALAEAARASLGDAGMVMVALAALLSTSSAINATVFGASRLMADMAGEGGMPSILARRNIGGVPWLASLALVIPGGIFTLLGGLEVIAAFSSMTFLLVSLAVSLANLRLRRRTQARAGIVLTGIGLMSATVALLAWHLATTRPLHLAAIAAMYLAAAVPARIHARHHTVHKPA